jgi:hypothetical protein
MEYCSKMQDRSLILSPTFCNPVAPDGDIDSLQSFNLGEKDNHPTPLPSPVTEVVASRTRSRSQNVLSRTVESCWLEHFSSISCPKRLPAIIAGNAQKSFDIESDLCDSQDNLDYCAEPNISDNELDVFDNESVNTNNHPSLASPDPNDAAAEEDYIEENDSYVSEMDEHQIPIIDISPNQGNDRFMFDKSDIAYMVLFWGLAR